MQLKPGIELQGGKYRIIKALGQGGFGITYLAEQTNLGRKVCIKEFFMKEYGERTAAPVEDSQETVLTDGSPSPKQGRNDNDATALTGVSAVTSAAAEILGRYKEKFIKEAKTIARLDHPGIVRIHDVFEENGTAYYVMDYIEGENLNDMVKREGALSEERALGYIRQVADALSYVHENNIMHLDVKPANIIVRKSDDKAILIDFGASKQYDSTGTQTSTTPVGLSAGYAPIEMMKVGGVQTFSPETDVYSLGATLYYLVAGQNPPDASDVLEDGLPEMPKKLSSSLRSAVIAAMKTRKQRPKSVVAFIELLDSKKEDEEEAARIEEKREEALRQEHERAEAERKRKKEEKARKDAEEEVARMEAKRKEALQQEHERVEAERKRKKEETALKDAKEEAARMLAMRKEELRQEYERAEAERKQKQEESVEEKFEIKSISASDRGNNTVFTLEVSMPSNMKKLYAFFSFVYPRSGSPITVLGETTQFGDRIVIDNSLGKAICKASFDVDFSNSSIQREEDGRLFFDLYVILSIHPSSTKIMDDDVISCYRFTIIHVRHLFKHDEWHSVKLNKRIQ